MPKTQWKIADYSYDHPDLQKLWNLGYRYIYRYMAGGPPKELTKSEYDAAVRIGFGVVPAYETNAGWMEGGWKRGVSAAQEFLRKAKAIGMPARSLYLAWDVQYPVSAAGMACARGAKSILQPAGCRTGIYLNGRFLTAAMFAEGFLVHVACYGCADGQIDKRAHIIQNQYHPKGGFPLVGGVIDENYATVPDFGQSNYGGNDMTEQEIKDLVNSMFHGQSWSRFAMAIYNAVAAGKTGADADKAGADFGQKANQVPLGQPHVHESTTGLPKAP